MYVEEIYERDAFVLMRAYSGGDEEGNPRRGLRPVAVGRCSFGYTSARERTYAQQQGEFVDAQASTLTPYEVFEEGDVIQVRGQRWRIAAVKDAPTHTRLVLQTLKVDNGA